MPYSLVGGYTLPVRTALIETTDNTGTVDIVATGLLNGNAVVHEEAIVGFLEGQVMLLKLFLDVECVVDPCAADPTKTCTANEHLGAVLQAPDRVSDAGAIRRGANRSDPRAAPSGRGPTRGRGARANSARASRRNGGAASRSGRCPRRSPDAPPRALRARPAARRARRE